MPKIRTPQDVAAAAALWLATVGRKVGIGVGVGGDVSISGLSGASPGGKVSWH